MPIVRQLYTRSRQLTTAIRDAGRLREIVSILLKHGFGYLIRHVDVPGMGLIGRNIELVGDENPLEADDAPERALKVINELGPTFVKLGQILSTRPNLIPGQFASAFERLQDEVDPIDFEQVQGQLIKNLGAEALESFKSIDPTPLASASIAQVHRACLKSGDEVVIKVQRPGVLDTLMQDLEVLKFLARAVENDFPEAKLFNPLGIIQEIERSVQAECDFTTEANHLRRFTKNFEGNEKIHIPLLYPEFCTSEILTEEFIDGVKITQAQALGHDLDELGQNYLNAAYQMLFRDGFFHGDLHPGNVLVTRDGLLAFIDFGMVGRLTPDMKDNCVDMVVALLREDLRTTARIFWEIGIRDEEVSYQTFETQVFELMERHFVGTTASNLAIGQFFAEITNGAVHHRIKMPTSYTMMFKAMVTTEGLVRMLVPDLDPVEFARPHVEELIAERYSQERLEKEAIYHLGSYSRILRRLPVALGELISDIEGHRLRVGIDLRFHPKAVNEVRRVETRRLMAAVCISFMLCSTLALPHLPAAFLGIPTLSLIGFSLGTIGLTLLILGYPRSKD